MPLSAGSSGLGVVSSEKLEPGTSGHGFFWIVAGLTSSNPCLGDRAKFYALHQAVKVVAVSEFVQDE
jgi:hypothetical protein